MNVMKGIIFSIVAAVLFMMGITLGMQTGKAQAQNACMTALCDAVCSPAAGVYNGNAPSGRQCGCTAIPMFEAK